MALFVQVAVDGEMVKCVELFTDDLSLTDLKVSRHCVRTLYPHRQLLS